MESSDDYWNKKEIDDYYNKKESEDYVKIGLLPKLVVGAFALLFGYAIFLPIEHNLIEFQGKAYKQNEFYSTPDLFRHAESLTQLLPATCNDFPNFEGLDDPARESCKAAWQKADFRILEPIENAECELRLPGGSLEFTPYGDLAKRETLEAITQQLPCPPEFLGTIPLYEAVDLEEFTFFRHNKIQRYQPHKYGDVQIYSISAGSSTRYAGFLNVEGTLRIVDITKRREDEAQHSYENPTRVEVDDYRFTRAIIALSNAGARDCSSFTLNSNGIVKCNGGTKWRIDPSRQAAIRQW